MKRQLIGLGLLATLALALFPAAAQAGPNTLVRDSIPDKYKWDLNQIYPDWTAWEQGLTSLQEIMKEYADLKGTLAAGPEAVLKANKLGDELGMLAYKVYRYPALTSAQDTRDNSVAARLQQVADAAARLR